MNMGGDMDKKTLAALKRSIEKWEGNASGRYVRTGVYDCPLCGLFWNDRCSGCPVQARTGSKYCKASPYDYAEQAREGGDAMLFRKASQKEVEFLKSLLPEGEK
jgi:hypothetical protein